jgi:CNT family concentrative nucleoside transporter
LLGSFFITMSTAGPFLNGDYIGNSEDHPVASTTGARANDKPVVQRAISGSSFSQEKVPADTEKGVVGPPTYDHHSDDLAESQARRRAFWAYYKPFVLAGIAAVILGWWISATILKATRHRW